ncbi:MAG TPA: helix-turn-helix domain-containing protein, partial [Polyangiales bacterium]|nr:helix-turn-helix domain-containing protein [Polyangiales bacterium]
VIHGDAVDALAPAVIGGARAGYYVRDLSLRSYALGVELFPGAAQWLFGTPASELAEAHTALGDVWTPNEVERIRDQLASQPTPEAQLDHLERILLARLPRVRALHPAIACALRELGLHDVGTVVHDSGYSHRGFNNLFSASVGLTPKRFVRVKRFAYALERVHGADEESLASLAAACGYSDQAHFTRDFREFSGLTPARYRAVSPKFAHHVPVQIHSRPVRAGHAD